MLGHRISQASQHSYKHDVNGVVLLMQVPRTNEINEQAAEQMFASLQGLLTIPKTSSMVSKVHRERIAFEIVVRQKRIGFYVWVPRYLKNFVEDQVYAQYPMVKISEVEDYSMDMSVSYPTTLVSELKLATKDVLPIKTFKSFEVDPLISIAAMLAKFEEDEEVRIQLLIRPASPQWRRKSERYQTNLKDNGKADYEKLRVSCAEEKSQKLAFQSELRIIYKGNRPVQVAKLRMQSVIASYMQFNTTYLNGFEATRIVDDPYIVGLYRTRDFNHRGYILNVEEVATLFHLPHAKIMTPCVLWSTSQTAEPPSKLPVVTSDTMREQRDNLSPIATTNFRGHSTIFGINRSDRSRHLYIIGETGVGKSSMLELLTISDIYSPFGFAVIDPHGDYALNILRRIPPERVQDVIYLNLADTDFPMAFNPMEVSDPKLKLHTTSELISVLKRMFESWGPRLEHVLRYSLLALLDYPNATLLDITRILTDTKFRADVIKQCRDPVVRNFWQVEFASWDGASAVEAVTPILDKLGAFTANPLVNNIIGQPKSSFNIRQIMDERKILIVNLSRGSMGEDTAALLGSLLVMTMQLAAMGRADVPAGHRTPFYLYVDEFQNLVTDSFTNILLEARKYGLYLTVAVNYQTANTAQMPVELKDTVFGNVGSIVAFRTGADDARGLLKYFAPKSQESNLVHMHNRHFVIHMTVEGEKVPAFSAISLNLPPLPADGTKSIISHNRARYASSRSVVENYVGGRFASPNSIINSGAGVYLKE